MVEGNRWSLFDGNIGNFFGFFDGFFDGFFVCFFV